MNTRLLIKFFSFMWNLMFKITTDNCLSKCATNFRRFFSQTKQTILGIKIAAKMDNQVSEASNLKCETYNYSVFLPHLHFSFP